MSWYTAFEKSTSSESELSEAISALLSTVEKFQSAFHKDKEKDEKTQEGERPEKKEHQERPQEIREKGPIKS